jgi:hypothetical protein
VAFESVKLPMRFLALSVAMVRPVHYHSVPVFQRPFGAILDFFLILVFWLFVGLVVGVLLLRVVGRFFFD